LPERQPEARAMAAARVAARLTRAAPMPAARAVRHGTRRIVLVEPRRGRMQHVVTCLALGRELCRRALEQRDRLTSVLALMPDGRLSRPNLIRPATGEHGDFEVAMCRGHSVIFRNHGSVFSRAGGTAEGTSVARRRA
jgi:hypothetical protein